MWIHVQKENFSVTTVDALTSGANVMIMMNVGMALMKLIVVRIQEHLTTDLVFIYLICVIDKLLAYYTILLFPLDFVCKALDSYFPYG